MMREGDGDIVRVGEEERGGEEEEREEELHCG